MQNEMLTLVLQKYKRKVYIISYKVQYYNAVTYFWVTFMLILTFH